MPPIRSLAAIMFSDIVGYTAMMQRDEANAVARIKRYRNVLADRVAAHKGEILQHYGDGSLTIFSSAVEALGCAKEIQIELGKAPQVPLRIGIHIGDVVRDEEELYGDGVNIASRVQSIAPPGGILFTERVWEDVRSHPEFRTISLGKFSFKNVDRPMFVYGLAGDGFPALKRSELSSAKGDVTPLIDTSQVTRRWPWLMLALAAVGLMAIGVFLYEKVIHPTSKEQPNVIPNDDPSIAVLPFKDLSPEGNQTYFGDGIAEEILNALTHVPGLKVAGRTSSFSFRDENTDMREIGRRLGVRTILEGSVRKSGKRVRITAQLINVNDGFHLWSDTYDRELSNVFAIQEEIARAAAGKLAGLLIEEHQLSLVKPGTDNQAAYESFLRGRYMLSQRAAGAEQAVAFFKSAIELDKNFAMAYAGLGNAYLWMGWSNAESSNEAFPQARQYAQKALELDSSLAYAQSIIGSVNLWFEWDWEAAKKDLEEAIVKNPLEARAYLDLGWYYAVGSHFSKAIAQMEKAVQLDPFNLEYNIDLADIYRMSGYHDKCKQVSEEMLRRYPDNSETYWILGLLAYNKANYAEAVKMFKETVKRSGNEAWAKLHLVMALAKNGNTEEAQKEMSLLEKEQNLTQTAPVEMAMAYLGLGQTDKALDMLENSRKAHANWLISLGMDPVWKPLHQHPRYKSLVRQMNFP